MKISINGFGRIGKTFLRALLLDEKTASRIEIPIINIGPCPTENLDLLFKYDSIMGEFPGEVKFKDNFLHINNHKIKIISEINPNDTNWEKFDIDWVIESSGHFTEREEASLHLQAGAKKVLITAPAKNEDVSIIPGINDSDYNPEKHKIVSLGSCTTNCLAPLIKVTKDHLNLKNCLMTTIHAYTNTQVLLDVEHPDPRRARAAGLNIIPTKTGAEKAILKIFPELKGKIQATAIRIPIPIVSIIDFTFESEKSLTSESINKALKTSAESELKGILSYTEKPLVSSDFKGNPHSCIIDSSITKATNNIGKIFAWYDNEWGYSQRLKDFLLHNA
ncbi:type I glyceraldehyde-3-phosphate dehydrogenase [Candidatus Babeliales bacterium]|nr:type I glyceraldehyde-3-phosphate dehydrogenase [Candidatus Babeliales bacterium]